MSALPLPKAEELVQAVTREELEARFGPEAAAKVVRAGRLYNGQPGEADWILVRRDAVVRLPHCEAAVARELIRAGIERRDTAPLDTPASPATETKPRPLAA